MMVDRVFEHHGGKISEWSTEDSLPGWYFWDEAYDYHGPFNTADEAKAAMVMYALSL